MSVKIIIKKSLLIDAIVKREEGGKPEWLPPDIQSTFAHADDLVIIVSSVQVRVVLCEVERVTKEELKSGFQMNREKTEALHTRADTVPPVDQQLIPSHAWEDKELMHLGLPLGGVDTEGRAKQTAKKRVLEKLKLVAPSRLPALEKAKLLNSKVAGALQFYAQTVECTEKEARKLNEKINEGFWGPGSARQKYVKFQRLTMPVSEGGVGLIDVPVWLEAFRRNQLVRLHRATVREEDDRKLVHTDKTLPSIFNHVVNAICVTKGMPCRKGSFFYLAPEVRIEIASAFPPYWTAVLDHFERTLGKKHSMERVLEKSECLDAVLACYVSVTETWLEDYDLDEDHAARMLMGPVHDADSNPTTNSKNPTTTIQSNNNNSNFLVPLGLVINNNPVEDLASINTPIPEATKALLCSSTPQQLEAAIDKVMDEPHYLMPLGVNAPLSAKGGTKFFYSKFKARQAEFSHAELTPEQEWSDEYPALAARSGRLLQDVRKKALKALRGNKPASVKSHAWHLYQARLTPPYWKCAWCGRPGKTPGRTANSNSSSFRNNGRASAVVSSAGRDPFKHQVWECGVFQTHWTRLRRKLGLPNVHSLAELCLGISSDGKREVSEKNRFRALTLHQGLWQERRKAMDREYDVILSLVIQKIMDFENRKSFAK